MLKEALLLGDRILFFSKKPGTVVFDYKVKSIRKPLTLDNKSVDSEYKKLKSKYPQLLEGFNLKLRIKEKMENFYDYIEKGGIIFSILLILSAIGLTLITYKFIEINFFNDFDLQSFEEDLIEK